jgi:hypothetical protein
MPEFPPLPKPEPEISKAARYKPPTAHLKSLPIKVSLFKMKNNKMSALQKSGGS